MIYSKELKKKLCEEIVIYNKSTIKTAEEHAVPLKTFEKWITAYRKDSHCFDETNNDVTYVTIPIKKKDIYDDMSIEELKNLLLKKDIQIARLKKNYSAEKVGLEEKVFTTFSKKNMK